MVGAIRREGFTASVAFELSLEFSLISVTFVMGQLFRSPTFVGVILFIVLSLSLVGVINLLLRDVLLLEHEINFTRFGVTQIGSLIGSDERKSSF